MKYLMILILLVGCKHVIFKDYPIKTRGILYSSFTIELTSIENRGDFYRVKVKTDKGIYNFKLPVECIFEHEENQLDPYLRVASKCPWVDANIEDVTNTSKCFEYHLYLPSDVIIKRVR